MPSPTTLLARLVTTLVLPAAAILAACGGGDDGGTDPGATATNTAGGGSKTGVVTIGDETFTFAMSTACVAFDGSIGAVGFTEDSQVSVDLDLPPAGWETSASGWHPPSIRVKDRRTSEERDWNAGNDAFTDTPGDYPDIEGKSQVDSYAIDGATATGTATFVDLNAYLAWQAGTADEPDPVTGTFEVDCN